MAPGNTEASGKELAVNRLSLAAQVERWSIEDFRHHLQQHGVRRGFLVFENGEFTISHPKALAPLRAFFESAPQFARHEAVFLSQEEGVPTVFFAFVHDTRRGLAQGGLRFDRYPNLAAALVDGLELSHAMTRKSALAGLWWGGGKGIIPLPPGFERPGEFPHGPERRRIFEAYGRFVASLGGVYYTAEDVGTNTEDMDTVLRQNRFTTCISRQLGGSGNPSPFTAKGVLRGMEAAWFHMTGSSRLRDLRVGVQGVGHVGAPLVDLLVDADAHVVATDVDASALTRLRSRHPEVEIVEADAIFDVELDIFAPCARGQQVNNRTIPRLKTKLVCGAANNILEEAADADRLRERQIQFVPDYVVNRMGITNCADEWLGYLAEDIEVAVERVYPDTLRVLKHADNLLINSNEAADRLADIAASELHPLFGHRGRRIIDHLTASGWHLRDADGPEAGEDGERTTPTRFFVPAIDEPQIRVRWEGESRPPVRSPAIAAAPVSAASVPTLASVLPAVFMDVRARALESIGGRHIRRVIGSDHGGLTLQLSVEWSLPHNRQEIGRRRFLEYARDSFNRNDAAIREQLHLLGIGYDPEMWLQPMNEDGRRACDVLFRRLDEANLLERDERASYWCPRCQTILVLRDLERDALPVDSRCTVTFTTKQGAVIHATTHSPELILGAAAIAVRADGPYGHLSGYSVRHPLDGLELPVIEAQIQSDAEFLVPAHDPRDQRLTRQHGITRLPKVFDDEGLIEVPEAGALPSSEARRVVLERLGEAVSVEAGQWLADVRRCARCGTVVITRPIEQLFVRTDRIRGQLVDAMERGAVVVSGRSWQNLVNEYLATPDPWSISRQEWWGQEIPASGGPHGEAPEVFSRWFSMVAMTMWSLGWPADPTPVPIEEVYTDPDHLFRWVIPAQLVAYALTGRPAFRRMGVLGPVHVIERELSPRSDAPPDTAQEDRVTVRTVRRPMRPSLGNAVEPGTLVRRFGADALRLGFLLCAGSGRGDVIVMSESLLRAARRSLNRLVAKATGLFRMAADGGWAGEPRLVDHWIASKVRAIGSRASAEFEEFRPWDAAASLLQSVDDFSRYVNMVAERRRSEQSLGVPGPAASAALEAMTAAFAAICPFLFEHLKWWLAETQPPIRLRSEAHWILDLEEALSGVRAQSVEVATPDPDLLNTLRLEQAEVERLTGARISVTASPSAGRAIVTGRLVVVVPGPYVAPASAGPAASWYRSLHLDGGAQSPR